MSAADSDPPALADHPLTAGRLEKFRQDLESGGYPYRFEREATAAELHRRFPDLEPGSETGVETSVAGRVVLLRSFGRLMFATIQDGSGRIQLFVDRSRLGGEGFERFARLDLGDWVGAAGEVITTKKGELSVRITSFTLLNKALRPLPDKWHGLQDQEQRYRRRYIDLIVNEDARRTALARTAIVRELRAAFERRGFLEVETPMLQVRPGGALARPFRTHHNALDLDMYLRIAPELFLKRLVIGGFERVFEINRNFRNEGIDSTHNPEFTMLEAYQAYADYQDIMELVESVIVEVCEAVAGGTRLRYQDRALDLTPPWRRVAYLEELSSRLQVEVSFHRPLAELRDLAEGLGLEVAPHWGKGKIIAELFEKLVEPEIWDPAFVVDYPKEVSPLSRDHRTDPDLVERFEVIAVGRELANAFSELIDPLEQRRRFEQQMRARAEGDQEAHPIDEDYLLALEYGLPPTGGLGIGVDRLVMVLTDQASIRDVVLFPHLRPESTP